MPKEIAEKIFFMPGRNRGAFPFCNSVFIDDEIRAIIDPASNKKDIEELKNISLAILSHFHTDHIRELRVLPNVKVAIHESEADALIDINQVVDMVFLPEEDQEDKKSWLEGKKRELQTEHKTWVVSRKFKDQDEISLGKTRIKVVHAPGHTIGHSCFWFPDHEILFSSDIDLTEFGPWYGNACSSVEQFLPSLEKLKSFKPRLVVTGHEAGIIDGSEFQDRLEKFKAQLFSREQKILNALAKPRTLEQIVDLGIIYGEFLQKMPGLRVPEKRMIVHHLRWLEKQGKIKNDKDCWVRL